ncbi:cache domain-containing protein [Nakamurella deserti]|uniref:cache domain-containing protein n=1 Tax=Nakamurella deserti TaxID=2164074 RepID=UPI000DBE1F69|nr:cache domain-containing protein [Nakamurella deserti]
MTGPSTLVPPVDAVADCVAAVSHTFAAMVATMQGWAAALGARGWPAAGPTPGQLDLVTRSLVLAELSRPEPTVVGAGFIARPDWVRGATRYLSWWLGPDNPIGRGTVPAGSAPVRRLSVDLDPGSDGYRDYTVLEWWRVPAATGRPHITGPYVDYLCTDEYTLTLTAPVAVRAPGAAPAMIGMVGMDIYVRTVESLLLPRLLGAGRPATLLNAAGRVVVSTDAHRAAGTVLRFPGLRERLQQPDPTGALPDGRTLHGCPGTGLTLLLDAVG